MKKRTKALCASITILVVLGTYADTEFTYTLADGAATITGASSIGTALDIPESMDGHPVVAIGARAFNFELDLERLTIPGSVTNIEEYAFALCHGMTEIVIPDSVVSIGRYAFYKCYDVERIEIGSGVKSIGKWAFGECYGLEDISIAYGVETIGEYAFGKCYSLERVVVPRSVTSIQWGAFAEIPALVEAYLPGTLQGAGSSGVFENSTNVMVRYYHCETPVAPIPAWSVAATDDLNGKICVTWKVSEDSEVSSFKIYRAMRPHFKKAALVAEVPADGGLVYEDTDVSSDYTYCYWIRAVNDIFEGELSEVATGYCEDPREELTYYVDAANGNDANDGLSKGTAVKTLQVAIDRTGNCDTIIVADGVYAPIETQNRRIAIESENGYKSTIIDGGGSDVCAWMGGSGADSYGHSLENWGGNKTVLRGFTLRNGSGSCGAGAIGGTLENCLIVSNKVHAILYSASPSGFGGGAFNSILRNCSITGNASNPTFDTDNCKWGGLGGGTYGCELYGCIEWDNVEDPDGSMSQGGMWDSQASEYDENCCFEDPLFADVANGDYRLMPNSPCIVNGIVIAGCEPEIAPMQVPSISAVEAENWISEDLATRYVKDGESAADYESRFVEKFGSDPVAAMTKATDKKDAQGNEMYVWQDYVAGTDPTDTNSVFAAKIDMVDGLPVVTWEPKLSASEEARRSYTIYGKTNLTDKAWHSPTNEESRFFKVGVEMR